MFKVLIKTTDKTTIIRANIVNYVASATVSEVYTTNMNSMYNPASMSYSQPKPIVSYNVHLVIDSGNPIDINIANEKDLNDFIDRLILAEEEQLTSDQLSLDELYQYAAEKILGNKHEVIPGFKIPTIEVNGVLIKEESIKPATTIHDSNWGSYSISSSKGGR